MGKENNQERTIVLAEAQRSWQEYLANYGCPEAVVLEVTTACTCGECAHCYLDAQKPERAQYLSLSTGLVWLEVLSSQSEKPSQVWSAGGEPTLHPDLGSFLGQVQESGFEAILVTNAERLADEQYVSWLLPRVDGIEVSLRGLGILHDLLMLPAHNLLWAMVPAELPPTEQIDYLLSKLNDQGYQPRRFEQTLVGLSNLANLRGSSEKPLIGLNIDLQAAADLEAIVSVLADREIGIDNIWLQVQQPVGRAAQFPAAIPNLWRQPTWQMVADYCSQARIIKDEGLVRGEVTIIDPLPTEIVARLELESEKMAWFYQPVATPAISVDGRLRPDVVG